MSARSFKRDHARAEAAAERRRARRARRATLATGAAIGATVVFAPSASAANFEVNDLGDGPADACDATCTLRDAVEGANDSGDPSDTITFADGLTGTITLTEGQLTADFGEELTITDAGTNEVTISGDTGGDERGETRLLYLEPYAEVTLQGLDLEAGYVDGGDKYSGSGGAILVNYAGLIVQDSTISGSYAEFGGAIANLEGIVLLSGSDLTGNGAGAAGGALASTGDKYADEEPPDQLDAARDGNGPRAAADILDGITVTGVDGGTIADNGATLGGAIFSSGNKYDEGSADSSLTTLALNDATIADNGAAAGGGTFSKYSDTTITDSTITGNEASGIAGVASFASQLDVTGSEFTDNYADEFAGAIAAGKYSTLDMTSSTVSGNSAGYAGGIAFSCGCDNPDYVGEPGPSTITQSTISDNEADFGAGGLAIGEIVPGAPVTVRSTTISGNTVDAEDGYGGGVGIYGYIADAIEFTNSTISGNSAAYGGGVVIDEIEDLPEETEARSGDGIVEGGSIDFDNTTIAGNNAAIDGGGIHLGVFQGDGPEQSTIGLSSTVVADNSADDLSQGAAETPGGFRLTNSLVETPGSAAITQDPAGSSILGTDPQLGPLADNGGPTLTHLPSATSPLIDVGLANGLTVDQRGLPRAVESAAPNGPGDGTDIGSVEVQNPTPSRTRALLRDEVPPNCDVPFDGTGLRLAGDNGDQTIDGSPGDDIIRGYGGDDTVLGVGGDDCLTGDSDDDIVDGGDGNDSGNGGDGTDSLSGGEGDDEMRGANDDDNVKLGGGDDKGVGGGGEDRVKGNGGDDAVRGRFGADKVMGDKGDDAVRGGGGNDLVKGGSGANALRGGGGDDTIVLAKGSSNEVNCGKGTDVVKGATKDDVIAPNCETVK